MNYIKLSILVCTTVSLISLSSAFAHHRTGSDALPEMIQAADYNEDGNLDVAVLVTGFDIVAILNGDGHGGLKLAGHVVADTLPQGLEKSDVNHDGHIDLVTTNQWGYTVQVLENDGMGSFEPVREMVAEGESTRVVLADFNSDGWDDILVNAPLESKVLYYPTDGSGGYAAEETELTHLIQPSGMAAGDLNGDGRLDAVILTTGKQPTQNQANIMIGDGAGGFRTVAQLTVDLAPNGVKIVDLNKDGKPDLIVDGALPTNGSHNFFTTFLGDGTGQFTLKQHEIFSGSAMSGDVALADFDEDGNIDMAIPNLANQVLIYAGDGTGNFDLNQSLSLGSGPETAAAGDFNKDGHTDLAVSIREDGTIVIALGDGSGNFNASSVTSVVCDTCAE